MNYRTVTLHAEENLGTRGTFVMPIRVRDPISALIFQARITFSTGARLIPEPDVFSKIEIVDGSDVLMSLSGTEMAALSFYEGNKQINWAATNLLSTTEEGYLRVNFGRFLRDPMLAFDPTKFLNPQLKVTYDTALVQALATPVYLRVIAECFDEKVISPVGYLRMTEYHSYAGSLTTYEYVDLPVDLDIRKLYLQTKEFGSAHFQLLTSVKLSEDNDKRVPFDLLCRDWMDMELAEFGRCFQAAYAQGKGLTYPIWCAPCNVEDGTLINASGIAPALLAAVTGGKFSWETTVGGHMMQGTVKGSLPYFVHCYPFGDQMDIDDWYKVAGRVDSLRFRVYSGAAGVGANYNTILQQLRRY